MSLIVSSEGLEKAVRRCNKGKSWDVPLYAMAELCDTCPSLNTMGQVFQANYYMCDVQHKGSYCIFSTLLRRPISVDELQVILMFKIIF